MPDAARIASNEGQLIQVEEVIQLPVHNLLLELDQSTRLSSNLQLACNVDALPRIYLLLRQRQCLWIEPICTKDAAAVIHREPPRSKEGIPLGRIERGHRNPSSLNRWYPRERGIRNGPSTTRALLPVNVPLDPPIEMPKLGRQLSIIGARLQPHLRRVLHRLLTHTRLRDHLVPPKERGLVATSCEVLGVGEHVGQLPHEGVAVVGCGKEGKVLDDYDLIDARCPVRA